MALSWSSMPASSTTTRSSRSSRAQTGAPPYVASLSGSGSPTASRVHTPSAFQRQPWAWSSLATDSAGTPSSRAATSATLFVGVTILVARPTAAAPAMATASMVVLPAPAAPSTTTSGSVEATAAAARACPSSSPRSAASVVTSGISVFALVATRAASRSRNPISAATTWRLVRWATCSGRAAPGGSTERQSPTATPVASSTRSRSCAGSARTPYSVTIRVTCSARVCRVHVEAHAAHRSSAREATVCTCRSSSEVGLHASGRQPPRGGRFSSGSYPALANSRRQPSSWARVLGRFCGRSLAQGKGKGDGAGSREKGRGGRKQVERGLAVGEGRESVGVG